MNFSMTLGTAVRKAGYTLLGFLYLSLSLYAISCAFHHDLLQPERHAHSHAQDGKTGETPSGEDLYCKLVQKISGSAAPLQAALSPARDEVFHPFSDYYPILSDSISRTNLSRGPPSA